MTVNVTLKTFGPLRDTLGTSEVKLAVEGSTFGDLLNALAQKFGPRAKTDLLDQTGNLDSSYVIVSGGIRVQSLKNPLKEGDEVVLSTAITGGSISPL